MEFDVALKILGAVAGVFVAIHKILQIYGRPKPRQILLEDLEVYSKIPNEFEEKDLLKDIIRKSYQDVYSKEAKKKKTDWSTVFLMPIFSLGLGYWTYELSKDTFSAWSLLTGLFALGAIQALFDEFSSEDESKPEEK
jgi:hypothetical protein